MKPVAKEVIERTSTLDGHEFGMSIDQNSLAHIMEVLTNLYSNERLAVLREYSTNALDAHIATGQTRPIEVTLPTPLKQTLAIQDWGSGLDLNDFENIYSRYGLSTKTETNEQTGFLGLGCKSALAYTHTFSVTGIKDGRKTVINVSKDDEGIGRMQVVYEGESDEPNGVKVIIPTRASDQDLFAQEARKLFKFWPEKTVLVDGEEPERYEGLKVSERITLRTLVEGGSRNIVLMGNVPYPVDSAHFDFGLPDGYGIVGKVPNGTMHIAPSREGLRYTKATIAALQKLAEQFNQDLLNAINKEIEQAATRHDALRIALRWRSSLPRAMRDVKFKYRDISLPVEIVVPGGSEQVFLVTDGKPQEDWHGRPYKVGYHSRMRAIDIVMVSDAIWVHDFQRTFTPNVKKKLWAWCDQNSRPYPSNFILSVNKIESPWIDPQNQIPWGPVNDIPLPRTSKATGRQLGGRRPLSYDMLTVQRGKADWEYEVLAHEIDPTVTTYYIEGDKHAANARADAMMKLEDDFQIVIMTANRIGKFKRLFPNARNVNNQLKEYSAIWFDSLGQMDKDVLSLINNHNVTRSLEVLPRYGILDPSIRRAQRVQQVPKAYREHLTQQLRFFSRWTPVPVVEWPNTFSRYPLMQKDTWYAGRISAKQLRLHNKIYVNATYTELYQES